MAEWIGFGGLGLVAFLVLGIGAVLTLGDLGNGRSRRRRRRTRQRNRR